MKIKTHGNLVNKEQGGNGYHGNCEHCGLALVTDLGYCSWDDTECIEHEIISESEVSNEVRNYTRFRGMRFTVKKNTGVYVNSYDRDYSIEELEEHVQKIKHNHDGD